MVQDYQGRPVPEEVPTTHTHPDQRTSLINFIRPTTIHSILCVQFTCLTVLFDNFTRSSLVLLMVLDPLLHTPCISSPNHHLFFAAHSHTIAACSAVIPMLYHLYLVSLSSLLGNLSFSLMQHIHPPDHSHLCSLKCHNIFFPYRPGITSMQHTASTQLLYNLPLIINDTSLLVSSGTNCLDLFQQIRIVASTAASESPTTLSLSPR